MAARRRPPRSLPRGRHSLGAEASADVHRERLHEAVVTLLNRDGYAATSVNAVAAEANVSTASLYALYDTKEELVLATWDAIVTRACDDLTSATAPAPAGVRAALDGVLGALVQQVIAQPDAARVAIVEVLAVGTHGPARRRRLVDGLERLLREAVQTEEAPLLSDAALAVLAGGTLQILEQHLRSGRLRPLRAAAQDLADWGARYETSDPIPLPPPGPDGYGGGSRPSLSRTLTLPGGRHGLPPAFVRHHQRERIVGAILSLAPERGCESISIRDICTHAQISHQTFYLHFTGREEALHAVYDAAFVELFARAWYAACEHREWPAEVRAAMTAWTQFVAAEPELADFGLTQFRSNGRDAAEQTEEAYTAFARLIALNRPAAADGPPTLVPYALASGIASLVGSWVADGRASEATALAPQLAYVVLAPFVGEPAARRATGLDPSASAEDDAARADLRGELMLAFAEAVYEDGYAATHLADVAQRAGIELDVASRLFEDEEDVAAQAVDTWARAVILAAANAFVATPADAPLAAHRALAAGLQYLVDHPALTALALSEAPPVLEIQAAHRAHYVRLFLELIDGTEHRRGDLAPQPQLVLQLALDGVVAVIRQRLEDGKLDQLPANLPVLSPLVLAPFFGEAQAARVASLPAETTTRP